jgi:hypothetical protein
MDSSKHADPPIIRPLGALAGNIQMDSNRGLRWVRLAETAERSLHWLIPAIVLSYIVFKLIRALGA